MMRRPPRSNRTDTPFPTRRSSDLDTTNLRTDAVDRELESEADRVVGDRCQVGDELRHVDERKGGGEDVDAAATRPNLRELDIGWIHTVLRERRPNGPQRKVDGGLSLIGRRSGGLCRGAQVVAK